MAYSSTEELLDDNNKLESKVVFALSRLGRLKKSLKSNGVSCKQIVRYLISIYSNLDGDIESQVMTALLSCVKTGIVCVLDNGKYILSGPSSKNIIAQCFARGSHGPNCACVDTIKRLSRSSHRTCCNAKTLSGSGKGGPKGITKSRMESKPKQSKRQTRSMWSTCKCAKKAQEMLDAGRMTTESLSSKCNFCVGLLTGRTKTTPRLCQTCYSFATGFVAPYNKFSPREELT